MAEVSIERKKQIAEKVDAVLKKILDGRSALQAIAEARSLVETPHPSDISVDSVILKCSINPNNMHQLGRSIVVVSIITPQKGGGFAYARPACSR